ncbi:hypothetical protein [Streptomyces sp. NBC_01304]|uniref:hypothetical protein n=1 Tax=Streptomyces sp. NBC_01304 TaxID=2903818 RepID=UPI002E0FD629|nr:hypothetical protein OG430_26950 [Streptomyces sp. NBC_01304]
MIAVELVTGLLVMWVQQTVQLKGGALALIGLLLIGVGVRARSTACAAVGVTLVAVSPAQL